MNTPISTLLAQMRTMMQNNRYSDRTETAYLDWITRYLSFHHHRHPTELCYHGVFQARTFLEKILSLFE